MRAAHDRPEGQRMDVRLYREGPPSPSSPVPPVRELGTFPAVVRVCGRCGLVTAEVDLWVAPEDGGAPRRLAGYCGVGLDVDALSLQRNVPPCDPAKRAETPCFQGEKEKS